MARNPVTSTGNQPASTPAASTPAVTATPAAPLTSQTAMAALVAKLDSITSFESLTAEIQALYDGLKRADKAAFSRMCSDNELPVPDASGGKAAQSKIFVAALKSKMAALKAASEGK